MNKVNTSKREITVVKIGGAFLEDQNLLDSFYNSFSKLEGKKIVVHGGGQRANQLSRKMGIEPRMAEGRRITDARSLELVTMVYGGWANKTLVAGLQAHGCNALGLSGADADLIRARKRPVEDIDYGFVGDIESVQTSSLTALLDTGFVPLICALTHDGQGQLLNTNADTIAAALAVSLSSFYRTKLVYCFEKKGVLRDMYDPESTITEIDRPLFHTLRRDGIIASGMIPKLFNSFKALEEGVDQVYIGSVDLLDKTTTTSTQIRL